MDGLGVLEVWIHPRVRIDEPGAKMSGGMSGIVAAVCDDPCRGKSGHFQAEANEGLAMVVEVRGVREAVAADIGSVRILRVGPPVVAF